ncbi:sulfate transporter [Sulfuricaulis limicola]|uniref:Sulfate transporter n=1 Tax=Sulfuricaulis limicola TaxID=1620215 RepID=A0A1B4XF97_9GAMM|nr:SulP family inorganic anion transporter [Sulfuricaulis limicola]BAV33464.1 sulfate transporter [Sulfuricaulis limicola]
MNQLAAQNQNSIWQRLFPFLHWWPQVNRHTLKDDLIAGLTVALVAIPQSLAYAQLSGVPAYYGLYAALIPVIIGVLFGSSMLLSTGPVAMTSLLTAASIMPLATYGTQQFYAYVILMALLSGLVQIGMGVARMGVLLNFLSYPVLRGFINAAAIIIGLAQLPAMVGLPLKNSQHFMTDILHVIENLDAMHVESLFFGLGSLALMALMKKFAPRLPGVLITVALTTYISYAIGFEELGGRIVGAIPQGLPGISIPPVDWKASMHMLPTAFVIALISFMEAMSSSKIIAIKTRTQWDENQELIGQGLAKVAAAFSHAMPVSGSFSRSALNLAAGARTGMSSIFSAIAVLLTLLFFTPLLHHLPKPVLAAIIMMAVIGLISFKTIKESWVAGKQDGIAAIITFIATLVFAPNIQNGILTGILLSLALFLFRTMKPRIVLLGLDKDGMLRNAERFNLPKLHPQVTAIRFDGQLYFANVNYFEESTLYLVSNDPDLKYILVVGSGINGLDASGVEMLRNLLDRLSQNKIELVFCSIKGNVIDVMQRTGLIDRIGRDNIFASEDVALKEITQRLARAELDSDGARATPQTPA